LNQNITLGLRQVSNLRFTRGQARPYIFQPPTINTVRFR